LRDQILPKGKESKGKGTKRKEKKRKEKKKICQYFTVFYQFIFIIFFEKGKWTKS